MSIMKKKVIASLTSYATRVQTVHIVIQALLDQTVKADEVILWLAEDEYESGILPEMLASLQEDGVTIAFCEDLKSYKKLIPTLKKYPNDIIITFDDDVYYRNDIIENLLNSYRKDPHIIHCMRGHKIRFRENGSIDKYANWEMCCEDFDAGFDIFPTGSGGVLYPPNCFHSDILNQDVFLSLAHDGDDIWFKAMSLKQGVMCKIVEQVDKKYIKLDYIEDSQNNALWKKNLIKNGNDPQIRAVFEKYGINDKRLLEGVSSLKYWEKRYASGGNSGAGSYNVLAQFKAEIINEFVSNKAVKSAVEFGCGDGNNLELYNFQSYTGVDVSQKAIEMCQNKFTMDTTKRFFTLDTFDKMVIKESLFAELALSLDVIYHLLEDQVYHDYMKRLFASAQKYVIIYSSNKDELLCSHVKHREFSKWIQLYAKNWVLAKFIENKFPYDETRPTETTFADFYIYEKYTHE